MEIVRNRNSNVYCNILIKNRKTFVNSKLRRRPNLLIFRMGLSYIFIAKSKNYTIDNQPLSMKKLVKCM